MGYMDWYGEKVRAEFEIAGPIVTAKGWAWTFATMQGVEQVPEYQEKFAAWVAANPPPPKPDRAGQPGC